MKTKHLLSTLLFLFTVTFSFAQVSFTSAGIAVQGIARDDNNTAIQNQTITLVFEFYYLTADNDEKVIGSNINKKVLTDDFGVFSTIITAGSTNNELFSNNNVALRIQKQGDGDKYMSDAPLNYVPYAISASNGVPTGTIVPFMGGKTDVPVGWLFCDGIAPIPDGALKTMLTNLGLESNVTPDLKGMFLRGAGTNKDTNYSLNAGPDLGVIQPGNIEAHEHEIDITSKSRSLGNLPISTTAWYPARFVTTGSGGLGNWNVVINGGGNTNYSRGNTTGDHTHEIEGSTEKTGIDETRPVNYGVNYIIKL